MLGPALYFVDTEGIIRDEHFGEGRYEQSERVIQQLLGIDREVVNVDGLGVEAEADWDYLRTPETYLGYERSEHFSLTERPRVQPTPRLRAPRAPAPQPLGPIGGLDHGGRGHHAERGERADRLPFVLRFKRDCNQRCVARWPASTAPGSPESPPVFAAIVTQ